MDLPRLDPVRNSQTMKFQDQNVPNVLGEPLENVALLSSKSCRAIANSAVVPRARTAYRNNSAASSLDSDGYSDGKPHENAVEDEKKRERLKSKG